MKLIRLSTQFGGIDILTSEYKLTVLVVYTHKNLKLWEFNYE